MDRHGDGVYLQGYSPAPPDGVFAQGADLQWGGLLVASRDAGVETGAEHFRRFPCLAENSARFCLFNCPFGRHFEMPLLRGRILSFSARRDPSYYAAAGVASRAKPAGQASI